jgi:hypothetical protein
MTDWMRGFCSDNGAFALPFSQGDWSYATDSCVAVRVPRRPQDAPLGFPDMEALFQRLFEASSYIRPPALALPAAIIQTARCPHCSGNGRAHQCPSCACRCDRCDGKGNITRSTDSTASVTLPSGSYGRGYVRRVWELPDLLIGVGIKPGSALPFAFAGNGQGLLMPQTAAYSDNTVVTLEQRAA